MNEQKQKYIHLLISFDFEKLFEEAKIAKFTPEEMVSNLYSTG